MRARGQGGSKRHDVEHARQLSTTRAPSRLRAGLARGFLADGRSEPLAAGDVTYGAINALF